MILRDSVLDSTDQLIASGKNIGEVQPISTSCDRLCALVLGLTHDSGTALGPAFAVALGVASQARGARIIMLTVRIFLYDYRITPFISPPLLLTLKTRNSLTEQKIYSKVKNF